MTDADIVNRANAIARLPGFEQAQWWLTFYLSAAPACLDALALKLSGLGAVNLGGAEGGFLYPKLPVENDPAAVAIAVGNVRALAIDCGVEVISVDVDTSPDVEGSAFRELARFA